MPISKDVQLERGDRVSVRATVKGEVNRVKDAVWLEVDGHYQSMFIAREHLTFLHHGFEVGEEVAFLESGDPATIKAIVGEEAWVCDRDGVSSVVLLEELTRRRPDPGLETRMDEQAAFDDGRVTRTELAAAEAVREEAAAAAPEPEAFDQAILGNAHHLTATPGPHGVVIRLEGGRE